MKLTDGNPLPPPSSGSTGQASSAKAGAIDPVRQLQALQLENRQAVVARVAQLLNERGLQQATLEIRGQSLTVNLPRNAPDMQVGDLIRIMREGAALTLLDKLPLPAEARLGQALIRHLPWQQHLDSGLGQLLTTLSKGLRAPPGASQPGATQPLPTNVREALLAIARLLPQPSGTNPSTTGAKWTATLATLTGSPASASPTTATAAPASTTTGVANSPPPASQTESLLDAARVRQWLASNGTQTEALLARGTNPGTSDLKLALGRLALTLLQHQNLGTDQFSRFTPLPSQELVSSPLQFPAPTSVPSASPQSSEAATAGQMLRLLAGMLNRITVNQLHSQLLTSRSGAEGQPQAMTLVTDLPWLNQDGEVRTAQLRIEEEPPESHEQRGTGKSGVSEWRFSLAMDLDEAGQVFFDVALRQQSVSARVWADQQATVRRVNQELGALRSRLTEIGLDVAELECRRGQPPAATTRLEHRLVDTRA